jgi:hypothetical protein
MTDFRGNPGPEKPDYVVGDSIQIVLNGQVGGRDRDRTGDPLLAKRGESNQMLRFGVVVTEISEIPASLYVPKLYRGAELNRHPGVHPACRVIEV